MEAPICWESHVCQDGGVWCRDEWSVGVARFAGKFPRASLVSGNNNSFALEIATPKSRHINIAFCRLLVSNIPPIILRGAENSVARNRLHTLRPLDFNNFVIPTTHSIKGQLQKLLKHLVISSRIFRVGTESIQFRVLTVPHCHRVLVFWPNTVFVLH
jgi:hypothetical protein